MQHKLPLECSCPHCLLEWVFGEEMQSRTSESFIPWVTKSIASFSQHRGDLGLSWFSPYFRMFEKGGQSSMMSGFTLTVWVSTCTTWLVLFCEELCQLCLSARGMGPFTSLQIPKSFQWLCCWLHINFSATLWKLLIVYLKQNKQGKSMLFLSKS